MAAQNTIFLHEEIMLLALRDAEGTIVPGTTYQYAIGGAILAELLLNERLRIEESRKKLVHLVTSKPLGDPLLDECLERISSAKRRASLQTWVSRLAGMKRLKHRVSERLCTRGILRADKDKVLFIFTRRTYPELDPGPEGQLVEKLRSAIFTDTADVDPRTVVLLSLANCAGLLKANFDKKKLKDRKARIAEVINGDVTGKATKEAIDAMHAAIMVAVILPAVIGH